jgi:cobalt-zinc-cadmium efflux system outer membrane protein
MIFKSTVAAAALALSVWTAGAQTVLNLSLNDAKSRLLKENLSLLAAKYDVANAEAEAIQARVWNNPNFVWNSDMYSLEKNQYLNYKNQVLIQLELMVPFNGRFQKAAAAADQNVAVQQQLLENTLRELIYEFSLTYHELAVAQQRGILYLEMEALYDQLIEAARMQFEVGAIAGSELQRLRSEQLAIHAEQLDNALNISQVESKLKTLLYLKHDVSIQAELQSIATGTLLPFGQLMAEMPAGRSDYQAALAALGYHKKNISLQKALAMGDVKLGYQPHDRGSNYVRPYQGIVVEIPLPTFNRNQGPIMMAQNELKRAQIEVLQMENEMKNELSSVYQQCLMVDQTLVDYSSERIQELKRMSANATANFSKRNLSLLEYIDLQRIYKQTLGDYLTVKKQQLDAYATLNYVTGKN